jgi:purine-nucleoside phosphorylase
MSTPLTPELLRALASEVAARHRLGRVRALLVAGSGLTLEVPGWDAGEVLRLDELLPLEIHRLPGHSHTVTLWRRGGETLLAMNGRLHLYQGYRPEEVVAPVRLAALLGAEAMLATNATGGVDPALPPGSLVVVSDHLNFQGSNPLAGEWGRAMGPQFPDLSQAYDPELRRLALEIAREVGFEVREGVYAAMLGPSFETPAEIRMLGTLGVAVVGMSTVPEVIAARHMGMRVLVLSLVTNPAAGLVARPLSHEEVLEAGRHAADRLRRLLGLVVERAFG